MSKIREMKFCRFLLWEDRKMRVLATFSFITIITYFITIHSTMLATTYPIVNQPWKK